MPLLMGRPAAWWSSGRSARTRRLVAVACGVVAVATALVVVSLCFVVGSGRAGSGSSTVATGFGKMTAAAAAAAAAAGAHPGDQVTEETVVAVGRRMLSGGPGSHPPRCTSKCGGCSPCYPVHVSVPRGVLVTTEYYPEAWRCKCRNQLYMP